MQTRAVIDLLIRPICCLNIWVDIGQGLLNYINAVVIKLNTALHLSITWIYPPTAEYFVITIEYHKRSLMWCGILDILRAVFHKAR